MEPVVRVYLGVPKLKTGAANVRSEWQDNGKQRFSELKRQVLEETRGGNEQEIAVKTLNVRLLLSTDDLSGYEIIPDRAGPSLGRAVGAPTTGCAVHSAAVGL